MYFIFNLVTKWPTVAPLRQRSRPYWAWSLSSSWLRVLVWCVIEFSVLASGTLSETNSSKFRRRTISRRSIETIIFLFLQIWSSALALRTDYRTLTDLRRASIEDIRSSFVPLTIRYKRTATIVLGHHYAWLFCFSVKRALQVWESLLRQSKGPRETA